MANESNTKKVLKKATFGFVLLPAALFVFIVAIGLICSLPKHYARTYGFVSEITTYHNQKGETKHRVYVTYEVDDEVYQHVYINEYSSSWHSGKDLTILYSKDNPKDIATNVREIISFVMFGFGGVLLIVGAADFIFVFAVIKDREPVDTILESKSAEEAPPEQEFLDLSENDNKKKKRKKDDTGLVDDPFGK